MTERSYPFDAGDGSALNEAMWSTMAGSWQTNGVDAPGPWANGLKVVATGQPFQLVVNAGHAKVAGFHYELDVNQTVLIEQNKSASTRMDRIVLKLDREANRVALTVKTGVANGSSTPPPLDRSWEGVEIPLAVFSVRGNSDTVLPADIWDTREFVSNGVQMLSPAGTSYGARQLAEGQLGYNPNAKKFYARDASREFELGPPQDLSPYLTKSVAGVTYAQRVHSHALNITPLNFTWQSGYSVQAANAYARAGAVHFHFSLERTASGVMPSGTNFASINAAPYGWPMFVSYVSTDNLSTVTKAACVALDPSGTFYTYRTFWGAGETLIVSGSYVMTPGSISIT
ncbi:hypothetical protein [Nonomuraea sp. NPDC052265]|uniref:hypothetical protein n=1 Tax=Nonomuraea sp. NPDC052265 TaxID=3364374 RepID=UPI0037CB1161